MAHTHHRDGAERCEQSSEGPARVYTIPPTAAFLETLAGAILAGDLPLGLRSPPDPLSLTGYTILLPTRRACRAMREAFLAASDGSALLLPAIRPLGDVDEDAEFFADNARSGGGLGLDMPPAIGNLERRLAMTELVLAWSRKMKESGLAGAQGFPATTPAQAVSLATELIRLLDEVESERIALDALGELAPERFAAHWQLTTTFLKIVTEHWPAHLEEQGKMSPYRRRDLLMAAETRRLLESPPPGPVIAAGSTGSVPATAALLDVVAHLDHGGVVLPGLDLMLDDESWTLMSRDHPEHPQFGMARLLNRLNVARRDVRPLTGTEPCAGTAARVRLLSETMRPASTTDLWLGFGETLSDAEADMALEGLTLIEAPTSEDEAETVALLMRQAAESPARSAILVTPDRVLARRVSARLETWDIVVDDSAGRPLSRTPSGVFLDLVVEVGCNGFEAVPLLALLKHPFARLGREPAAIRQVARRLELIAFRSPRLATGLAGARGAVKRTRRYFTESVRQSAAIERLGEEGCIDVERLLDDLEAAFEPLASVARHGRAKAGAYFEAHAKVAENLAQDENDDRTRLWRGDDGEALALHFAELMSGSGSGPELAERDYPDFYRSLIGGTVVRPRRAAHPRLAIWGPLEARLQRADLVVVAGLNEGTWPKIEDPDPWLSRPMREAVGLPAPERRIGLAAHDVAQLMAAPQVVVTRAAKVDGVPTVASRWILRLEALLKGIGKEDALRPSEPWLAWARQRDDVSTFQPAPRPDPKPPVAARPRRMSVTRIEEWIANPYAVFARDILDLEPLPLLAGEPDAALRGQLVHEALHRFAREHPDQLPQDPAAALMALADSLFQRLGAHPRIWAFWKPQFARFADWFGATESERRRDVAGTFSEVRGELAIAGPAGSFTLTARADRIDLTNAGDLVIYDYKTGSPPGRSKVDSLVSPQLPLEAAIAAKGHFDGLESRSVSDLRYIHVLGAHHAGSDERATALVPAELAEAALNELTALVSEFDQVETPYAPLRRPEFLSRYRYDDYAHLARIGEWTDDEEAGPK